MRPTREQTGFAPPPTRPPGRDRTAAVLAELLTTLALVLGTIIAATVAAGMTHG
jgi:hypothetical protein